MELAGFCVKEMSLGKKLDWKNEEVARLEILSTEQTNVQPSLEDQ